VKLPAIQFLEHEGTKRTEKDSIQRASEEQKQAVLDYYDKGIAMFEELVSARP
jgi:hypothetical protein